MNESRSSDSVADLQQEFDRMVNNYWYKYGQKKMTASELLAIRERFKRKLARVRN